MIIKGRLDNRANLPRRNSKGASKKTPRLLTTVLLKGEKIPKEETGRALDEELPKTNISVLSSLSFRKLKANKLFMYSRQAKSELNEDDPTCNGGYICRLYAKMVPK